MNWFHKVDPAWLEERKKYLSASDVKKLIPITATGRARANMAEANLKAWAEKQAVITEDDICSSGPMARGHLLEPYAITEFNKLGIAELYHWDDALIYAPDGMSCSPDALDMFQTSKTKRCWNGAKIVPAHHGEVKAYNAATHYAVGLGDKMTLEERWQIATAFYVMPTLKSSFLIMYHPGAKHPLFYHEYVRAELEDELVMITQVVKDYAEYVVNFALVAETACPAAVAEKCELEESIIAKMLEEQERAIGLNP
jgi:hypothetical protein